MFVVGKLIHFLIHPLHILLLLLLTGLVLRRLRAKRLSRIAYWSAGIFAAVVSLTPIGSMLAYAIENRIEAVAFDLDEVAGVIVLGGATGHGELAAEHDTYTINDGAERLTTIVALRLQRPDLPVIVTGGSGLLFPGEVREAEITRLFLEDMGVDPASVVFETESRNTRENAVFTARLLDASDAEDGRPWLLVTSAFHMPRALGCFRQVGIDVIPAPVDYRIGKPSWTMMSPWGRFGDLDMAMSEIVGLVTYRLARRTNALFPDD